MEGNGGERERRKNVVIKGVRIKEERIKKAIERIWDRKEWR